MFWERLKNTKLWKSLKNTKLGKFLRNIKKITYRKITPLNWYKLRSLKPISCNFGFERGTPIDRFYIDRFLSKNRDYIKGTILEIAEDTYSRKFAKPGSKFEILHYTNDNPKATIVGDLTKPETLPLKTIDCFICTQALMVIYDFKSAISGIYHVLKDGGVALVTVSGIAQISCYDMERWGEYWSFTTLSTKKVFSEVFGEKNVEVDVYGNVLAAVSFLEGISAEELTEDELLYKDVNYQLLITVVARK